MAYINVDVDIDIDDYLEEAGTKALIRELRRRDVDIPNDIEDRINCSTATQKLQIIKCILGLKNYASQDDILKEMRDLCFFTNCK